MRPSLSLRCLCRALPPAPRPTNTLRIPFASRPAIRIRPQTGTFLQLRHKHAPTPSPEPSTTPPDSRLERDQVPAYELTFTCKKCSTRSSHRVSKQGYHHGTVLIGCPGCKNRHLISDHLKIFSDKPVTIEDLMREKGQLVKRGSLAAEGDVELWDDGTTTPRSAQFIPYSSDATNNLTEPPSPAESSSTNPEETKEPKS